MDICSSFIGNDLPAEGYIVTIPDYRPIQIAGAT